MRSPAEAGRVAKALARWKRRSRLIHLLRRALPAAIALLVATLFGWTFIKSLLANLPTIDPHGMIRMTNPHYYGKDDHGRSFLIDATAAERAIAGGGITLFEPHLRLVTGQGKSMDVSAHRGLFDDVARQVRLTGDVQISASDGTRFRTQAAQIDVRTGDAAGNSPIQGAGPLGQMSASAYAIHDRGARVEFRGQVHAHLLMRRK